METTTTVTPSATCTTGTYEAPNGLDFDVECNNYVNIANTIIVPSTETTFYGCVNACSLTANCCAASFDTSGAATPCQLYTDCDETGTIEFVAYPSNYDSAILHGDESTG